MNDIKRKLNKSNTKIINFLKSKGYLNISVFNRPEKGVKKDIHFYIDKHFHILVYLNNGSITLYKRDNYDDLTEISLKCISADKDIRFKTEDGYVLKLTKDDDGNKIWTDGDMIFDSRKGKPIDCFNEELHGNLYREEKVA